MALTKVFDDSKKIFEKVRVLLKHGGQHDVLRAAEVTKRATREMRRHTRFSHGRLPRSHRTEG